MRIIALVVVAALWPAAVWAGLTEQQIKRVALSPPPGATAPTEQVFKDLTGKDVTLGDAMAKRATLLLPADFTCKQICGPALSIAASALRHAGLIAGRDYSLVVVGIDASDGVEAARRFASGQVGGPGVSVLSGDSAAIEKLTLRDRLWFRARRRQRRHRPSGGAGHAQPGRTGLADIVEPCAAADRSPPRADRG